ncbi:hypothetical protein [Streptomyces sp. P17]|nr:hypothetical protein [Streptomyces sp. P17]MDT9700785.1 hypothetical protein [Streptomyces sp. P17]
MPRRSDRAQLGAAAGAVAMTWNSRSGSRPFSPRMTRAGAVVLAHCGQ